MLVNLRRDTDRELMRNRDRLGRLPRALARARDHLVNAHRCKLLRYDLGLPTSLRIQADVHFAASEHTADEIVRGMTDEMKYGHRRASPQRRRFMPLRR